jgi:gluconokinase
MIVIVAGVSGSGKSTVGALLAGRLGWPFIDGDLLHPPANIEKMRRGEPLTDEDRLPWLRAIGDYLDEQVAVGGSALVACSALKRSYRDLLLGGRPEARIVFLQIDEQVATRRLAARHGHFFNPGLIDSQFADLELPRPDETGVVVVPVGDRAETTADEVVRRLRLDGAGRVLDTGAPGSGNAGGRGAGGGTGGGRSGNV